MKGNLKKKMDRPGWNLRSLRHLLLRYTQNSKKRQTTWVQNEIDHLFYQNWNKWDWSPMEKFKEIASPCFYDLTGILQVWSN